MIKNKCPTTQVEALLFYYYHKYGSIKRACYKMGLTFQHCLSYTKCMIEKQLLPETVLDELSTVEDYYHSIMSMIVNDLINGVSLKRISDKYGIAYRLLTYTVSRYYKINIHNLRYFDRIMDFAHELCSKHLLRRSYLATKYTSSFMSIIDYLVSKGIVKVVVIPAYLATFRRNSKFYYYDYCNGARELVNYMIRPSNKLHRVYLKNKLLSSGVDEKLVEYIYDLWSGKEISCRECYDECVISVVSEFIETFIVPKSQEEKQ